MNCESLSVILGNSDEIQHDSDTSTGPIGHQKPISCRTCSTVSNRILATE